jgi:hypothetical protein
MSRRDPVRSEAVLPARWRVVGGVVLVIAAAWPLPAQDTGALTGRITSAAAHTPVSGADVSITLLKRTTRTGSDGTFRLDALPAGEYDVTIRKVGYSPTDFHIEMASGRTVTRDVVLLGVQTLDSVTVNESTINALGDIAWSRKLGRGVVIDREQLEKARGRTLSSIIGETHGLAVVLGHGTTAYAASRRIVTRIPVLEEDRNTGARTDVCYAEVYLDGVRVYRPMASPVDPLFDLNSLAPEQVEAIEMYRGASEIPSRYSGLDAQCGLMIIHMRKPNE